MRKSRLNRELMRQLYEEGETIYGVAIKLGCSKSIVWKCLPRELTKQGVWDRANDEELREHYSEGWGYSKCSKHFGVSDKVIEYACHRLGINDPSRVYTKIHNSNAERTAKRRPFEFTQTTKHLRFEQELGVCQWCHMLIESRFKATYHHIKLIDEGGTGAPENCMVLHRKCHITNFEVLHNGRCYRFGLKHQTTGSDHCTSCKKHPALREGLCGNCQRRKGLKMEICPICHSRPTRSSSFVGEIQTCHTCAIIPLIQQAQELRARGLFRDEIGRLLGVSPRTAAYYSTGIPSESSKKNLIPQ